MSTTTKRQRVPSGTDELLPRLLTGLVRVGMLLRSDGLRRGRALGLTPTQRQILLVLRAPRQALRLAEVAAALDLGSPTVSAAVGALVRKGAVLRERDPGDRRALVLRLTATGRELAAAPAWPPVLHDTLSALSATEQRVLLGALSAVVRDLEAEGPVPVGVACLACQYYRAMSGCARETTGACAWMGESAPRAAAAGRASRPRRARPRPGAP